MATERPQRSENSLRGCPIPLCVSDLKQKRAVPLLCHEHCRTFGIDPSTIRQAMEAFIISGFFIVIEKDHFQPTIYRVVSQEEWAKANLARCAIKAEFLSPDEEGDELGVRAHTVSGGHIK